MRPASAAGAALLVLIAGCTTLTPPPEPGPQPAVEVKQARGEVVASNDRFVLYAPDAGDSFASIAQRFLGHASRQWEIADFNDAARPSPGKIVAIPLRPTNPQGVRAHGYQTVPILCYHRIGSGISRMIVSRQSFEAQLDYLARNGYRVVRLRDIADFVSGKKQLPKKAVVLTFDDGHVSAYQQAFPLLKKYGFPATFFLYTDFLTAKDALNWSQIREMADSGLADFQSHSKTHANLVVRLPDETDQQYRRRLDTEIRVPRELIERNVATKVTEYAYPYGDANEVVLERMTQSGYRLGLTVNPGGNAFFAHPLMLRRTMILGEQSVETFKSALDVFKEVDLR